MVKLNLRFTMNAMLVAAAFGVVGVSDALAQKKLSYEQAWASCKKEINANAPSSDVTTSAARSAAGGACMKKYGYRLKKKNS